MVLGVPILKHFRVFATDGSGKYQSKERAKENDRELREDLGYYVICCCVHSVLQKWNCNVHNGPCTQ